MIEQRGAGKRDLADAHSFFVVGRSNGFVRVSLRRSDPRKAQIDIVSGARAVELRRRSRVVRAWLNGREVSKALTAPHGARRSVALSATHGLRFGVNRLRVSVVEPEHGRYAMIKRRFVIDRDGPLAAAGWDRATVPGVGVRLGGRARSARGGRLRYQWKVVRRPRGSTARVKPATGARPRLVPDRSGRYVLREFVSEQRRGGASAAFAGSSSADDVTVFANPSTGLLKLAANAFPYDPRGIYIGDSIAGSYAFHHPGKGATIQFLMVNRGTFEPEGSGNTWCCEDQGGTSLASLQSTIAGSGLDQLVVITLPPNRITLGVDQEAAFNDLLSAIGVNPLSKSDFAATDEQITIVGVPGTAKGTGWIRRRTAAQVARVGAHGAPTQGWLMVDGKKTAQGYLRFRFQPERLPFATNSGDGMTIGDQAVNASLPIQATSWFQVVEVDPRSLDVVANQSFPINGSDNPEQNLDQMAAAINAARAHGNYVAVQSIGSVSIPGASRSNWSHVTEALVGMGANPHLFNIAGSYAFFGGPSLTRGEVIQSNSQIVLNPTATPPTRDTGTLQGRLRMDPDGNWVPTVGSSGLSGSDGSLYDKILVPSTAWPYTAQWGLTQPNWTAADTAAYAAALAYITANLSDLDDFGSDLRKSYLLKAESLSYQTSIDQLTTLHYPAPSPNGTACPQWKRDQAAVVGALGGGAPARGAAAPLGFSYDQFCNLRHELLTEFNWIERTRNFFKVVKAGLQFTGDKAGRSVQSIGHGMSDEFDTPNDALASSVLALVESMSEVGAVFEVLGEGVSAGVGLLASAYDLGSGIASDSNGQPLSQQIDANADELGAQAQANVAAAAESLNVMRAAGSSDYGRLRALAALAKASDPTAEDLEERFSAGLGRYFVSELSPLVYPPASMRFTVHQSTAPKPGDCEIIDGFNDFSGAPAGAWAPFQRSPGTWETRLFVYPGIFKYYWPPDDITDQMFKSPFQGTSAGGSGWGMEKTTWLWQQGDPSGDSHVTTCAG